MKIVTTAFDKYGNVDTYTVTISNNNNVHELEDFVGFKTDWINREMSRRRGSVVVEDDTLGEVTLNTAHYKAIAVNLVK